MKTLSVLLVFAASFAAAVPPKITSLTPAAVHVSPNTLQLTVTGTGFDSTTVIKFKTVPVPSTLSGSTLTATLPAGAVATAGSYLVSVYRASDHVNSGAPAVFLKVVDPMYISLAAAKNTVLSGQTLQFAAAVTNFLADSSVKYSVTGPGAIDQAGLYTPGIITADTEATVTATSNEDASQLVNLPVTVTVPVVALPESSENYYCAVGDTWTGPATDGPAQLPKTCIYTSLDGTPSPGIVVSISSGANINQALAQVHCGDTLLLASGGHFAPFTLPAKPCDATHWITIRSSAADNLLPPEHTRINPSWRGVASLPDRPPYSGGKTNVMASIVTSVAGVPAIGIPKTGVASFYRIGPGLEITRSEGIGIVYGLVDLTGADHVILDRDWIHGSPLVEETAGGVNWADATYVAVINSYMNDFKCIMNHVCSDAKAIYGGDGIWPHGMGTWKAYNNFLEASGENILHGGQLTGNQTPVDLEYRQNHFYKPPSWRTCTTNCNIVKNLLEFKNASQALIEGNRFEGSWGGYTQAGFAILFTPRGDWSHDDNITVRYNYISHVGSLLTLAATLNCHLSTAPGNVCPTYWEDSASAGNWSIHDLVFDDVNPTLYAGGGTIQLISQFKTIPHLHHVKIDHITAITLDTKIFTLFVEPTNPTPKMGPFIYTNSIAIAGKFSIWSTGGNNPCVKLGYPETTFRQCHTNYIVSNNLIIGWKPTQPPWPPTQQFPATPQAVFRNFKPFAGDYHVIAPYKGTGTDGLDPGADIDTISNLLKNVN